MRVELKAPYTFSASLENTAAKLSVKESRASALQKDVISTLEKMSREQRAGLYARVTSKAYESGLVLPDKDIPMIPIPAFFDREEMKIKAAEVEHVHNALAKVEQLAFSDHPVGKQILKYVKSGMTPVERTLLEATEAPYPSTAKRRNTRADTFYNQELGEMSIIEVNTTNPEGMLYHHILQKSGDYFMKELGYDLPELSQNENANSAAHQVTKMFQDEYQERKEVPLTSLGVIYEPEPKDKTINHISYVNRAELPRLKAFFAEQGINITIGSPTDVKTQNGQIFVQGTHVDALWRNAVDLEKAMQDAPGFMDVMMHPRNYVVLNDDRGRLMGSKHLLGELHDPAVREAAGLTPDEIAAIDAIVPFSFNPKEVESLEGSNGEKLTPREYLQRFREYYILKPSSGTHGEEVHFGINNGTWNDAVSKAIEDGGYVAQRYIPYESITFPITTVTKDGDLVTEKYMRDTNIHIINGKAIGTSICRAMLKRSDEEIKILNVAAGGGLQASLII